jgi:SnoaL-like domain
MTDTTTQRPREITMSTAVTPTPRPASREAGDRMAIRDLIDAYARFADRRQAEDQAALYVEYGRTLVYNDATATEPTQVITGHDEHVQAFGLYSQSAAAMHFNGQSSIAIQGDQATGETYSLAHHLIDGDDGRTLVVMFISYEDSFVKRGGIWRFAERRVRINWTDSRPSLPMLGALAQPR